MRRVRWLSGWLIAMCGCQPGIAPEEVTIKGSDTMVHLVTGWAEEFMKIQPSIEVTVTGGGSGTGIAALLNGTTDLCASSRDMKEEERKLAKQKGIDPQEFVVARDGLAVVVNPKNPIEELTIQQVGDIYTGKVTSWSAVGGPAEPIIVLSRESSSGTYVFFQEHVLGKQDYTASARLISATSSLVDEAAQTDWAIAYVGLGYVSERIKPLRIKKDAGAPAIVPSEETVKAGTYSIARPLYLYSNGAPAGAIKKFVDFCLGPEGQKIVRESGYVTAH